jgi:hypothetical protein
MSKPSLVVKLERQIRHHRDMRWKYWKNAEKRDYHDRWRAAAEKELAEYLRGKQSAELGK